MALNPRPVPNLEEQIGGPMGVTPGLVLYYDPKWVEETPESQVGTGLAHEVLHFLLKHFARGLSYADKMRWNRAGDYAINYTLDKMIKEVNVPDGQGGFTVRKEKVWDLVEWALLPERDGLPDGLTAEQYYKLLSDLEKQGKSPQFGPSKIMAGGCGGVAGNPNQVDKQIELEKQLDAECGRTEADVSRIRRGTIRSMKEHEAFQGRGSSPGLFEEIIDSIDRQAVVPWHVYLSSVVRATIGRAKTGGLDYSMARPSRRSLLRGIILPGLIKRDFTLLYILDTSGSMGREQLEAGIIEAANVLQQCGLDFIYFMEADADVSVEPARMTLEEFRKVDIKGRGGTDFTPAIKKAANMRPRPDVVIYSTDGDGRCPAQPPPGIEFIWCIVPTPHGVRPPWGEVILVNKDQVLCGHH